MWAIVAGVVAGVVAGTAFGYALGYRTAVATRTYRDARKTTKQARNLWLRIPRAWGRVGAVAWWPVVVVVLVVAYVMGRS